ncbi:hypothetical protein SAMN05518800_3251 [Variovorax sp. YR752]|uniref:hypothetical protein n=1 Tax=Variovorax sp. YR752 TaxID=1884383 RepID=UPI000BCBDD61|nr:hypothetical protein [Variovorax sp. YR752]SOD27686.1 hypothetical protein SAMN05518800_3251 [Variovorax sp. YR752]
MEIEAELVDMARRAGELGPADLMRPTLRDFADQVAGRCARIGDLYGDWDRNAGDHIRAVLYSTPSTPPQAHKDEGHEPE